MDQTASDLAHLYRRAGFGATLAQLNEAADAGYEATVDTWVSQVQAGAVDAAASLIEPPELTQPPTSFAALAPGSSARRQLMEKLHSELSPLVQWWIARMVATTNPLTEKLPFLLHCQFPTAVSKVQFPSLMLRQNMVFRLAGAGSFDTLTQQVAKDPAMLIWLDAGTDHKADPNENFARELMERFTMGVGNYTEEDVRAAAVCFTGWTYDLRARHWALRSQDHDYTPQTILGQSGINTGEQVIDLVTHTSASAAWVVSRMWSFLATPVAPSDSVVSELVPSYASDLDMANLIRAIFSHPQFRSPEVRSGLIKQPVEWVAGALRALCFSPDHVAQGHPPVLEVLAGLGQIPFDPPSVGGWPQNSGWLSTATALVRWKWAYSLTRLSDADFSIVADAAASDRVDAVAELLSIDSWSPTTASALARTCASPPDLVTLALVSPEYVSN